MIYRIRSELRARPFSYLRLSFSRFHGLDFERKELSIVHKTSRDHLLLDWYSPRLLMDISGILSRTTAVISKHYHIVSKAEQNSIIYTTSKHIQHQYSITYSIQQYTVNSKTWSELQVRWWSTSVRRRAWTSTCPALCKACTPDLPTNIIPTNIAWLKLCGKFPMGLGMSPLRIKIMLDSNPLKSITLVRRLAVAMQPASKVARQHARNPINPPASRAVTQPLAHAQAEDNVIQNMFKRIASRFSVQPLCPKSLWSPPIWGDRASLKEEARRWEATSRSFRSESRMLNMSVCICIRMLR